MDRLLTSDSWMWPFGMVVAVLFYTAGHTTLVSAGYADMLKDAAALVGFVCAAFKESRLPHSGAVES